MSENIKEKKSKLVPILLIIIAVLLAGGIIAAVLILLNQNKTEGADDREPSFTIGYEQNGVVALDPDDFQQLMEGLVIQAQEGMMDLTFRTIAISEDGVNFACDLGNDIANRYDMYLNIYLDEAMEQQVLLTGLLPPGAKLESFKSEIPLEVGEYESILVFTQVDDDHATIVGQSMVSLTLKVLDEREYQTGD